MVAWISSQPYLNVFKMRVFVLGIVLQMSKDLSCLDKTGLEWSCSAQPRSRSYTQGNVSSSLILFKLSHVIFVGIRKRIPIHQQQFSGSWNAVLLIVSVNSTSDIQQDFTFFDKDSTQYEKAGMLHYLQRGRTRWNTIGRTKRILLTFQTAKTSEALMKSI